MHKISDVFEFRTNSINVLELAVIERLKLMYNGSTFALIFDWSIFNLVGNKATIKIWKN